MQGEQLSLGLLPSDVHHVLGHGASLLLHI